MLGYDNDHTPIASAAVTDPTGKIELPGTAATELKVTLAASTYVPPASAGQPTASDACPQDALRCQIVAPSGNPKDDPMWHCTGR